MTDVKDLTTEERDALRSVLESPTFELIPLSNALDQAAHLPDGATVSVTASPTKTLEDSLDLAAALAHRGFRVVPHLSARMVRDGTHLEALLERIEALDIDRVFVVGGDADQQGVFFDAGSLLRAMDEIGHDLQVGIGAYPEGHHVFDAETARLALHDKQPLARYMVTQMCFDGDAIARWLKATRDDGITLPLAIGIPGVADRLKLMRIGARIGVGQSVRYLSKNAGLIRAFVSPGRYSPSELLEDMTDTLADPDLGVVGTHIYTFNQVETTEHWRREYLARL